MADSLDELSADEIQVAGGEVELKPVVDEDESVAVCLSTSDDEEDEEDEKSKSNAFQQCHGVDRIAVV